MPNHEQKLYFSPKLPLQPPERDYALTLRVDKLSIVLGRFQILLKDQTKLLCICWQQSMDARGSFLETQEISLKNIQISGHPLVPVSN